MWNATTKAGGLKTITKSKVAYTKAKVAYTNTKVAYTNTKVAYTKTKVAYTKTKVTKCSAPDWPAKMSVDLTQISDISNRKLEVAL